MNELRKEQIREKFIKKELLKPNSSDELVKEVEFLCGELSNCPSLDKMKGSTDVDVEDDILF